MDSAKTLQKKIREAQGQLSHRAFAKKIGLSVGTLARLKNSGQNVTLKTVDRVAAAFHVHPSRLLDERDRQHLRRQ